MKLQRPTNRSFGRHAALAASVALGVLFLAAGAGAQDGAQDAPADIPAAAAPAQATENFEDEFKAFREKMQAARGETPAPADAPAASPTAPASPVASPAAPAIASPIASPVASPIASPAASPVAAMPAAINPLGPAANLPLAGEGGYVPAPPEDMQALMALQAAEQQRKMEQQVFDKALQQLMPLKPDQIRETLQSFQESREAAETPVSEPVAKQVVETVSLDPSDAPVSIMTAPGNVTTLTILDSTGAPWPILDVSWAGKFEITPPEEGGHVIRITPQSAHGTGNISIRLVDLVTPVTMMLRTGLDEVHYRFDARIPRQGPLAKPALIEYGGLSATAGKNGEMDGILDGTPPAGAVRLAVEGADGRTTAYMVEDRLYLRTPLTLLSPGWEASISSADGMNVYNLQNAPVVLLSDQGRMVRARIAAEEETLP